MSIKVLNYYTNLNDDIDLPSEDTEYIELDKINDIQEIEKKLESHNIDFILFDYNSDYELNKFRILNKKSEADFIVYSSNEINSCRKLLSMGFTDYIPKYSSEQKVLNLILEYDSDNETYDSSINNKNNKYKNAVESANKSIDRLLNVEYLDDGINVIMESFKEHFEYNVAGFWVFEDNKLVPHNTTLDSDNIVGEHPVFTEDDNSLSWNSFKNNESIIVNDMDNHKSYEDGDYIKSEIIIPIGKYGVINIGSTSVGEFDYMEVDLLDSWSNIINEILHRIELQNNLSKEKKRLERTLSFVNHDLVNPLSVAKGYASRCAEEYNDEKIHKIQSSINRMEEIIDNIKHIASNDDLDEQKIKEVNISDLVSECSSNIDSDNAQINNNIDMFVKADRSKLRHLFENIFKNAIEHSGVSNTKITVGEFENGFYISDNGKGIKQDTDQIFEFGKSKNGSGIGLNICRRIANMHGWEIEANNDNGAVFKLYIE